MKLNNAKILITGTDGFIGSHLLESLLDEGAQVQAFCYYNSFGSYGWLDTLPKKKLNQTKIFMGDIRDPNGVRTAMKGQDMVFHLAALIGIPYSYHSPDNYVDTNIKGTLNVLQAARDLSVKRVFVTSTSEVYGTALYVPIDEKHPLQAQSPYSATKIAADSIAESFFRSFGLPVTIVRPFNTYGPRQSARAVIPTIITQVLAGVKKIKLGDLSPRRDFNFVKDTCQGFIEIAKSDKTIGESVNIASGKDFSVKDIVDKIIKLSNIGHEIKIIEDSNRIRPKKSEVMRLLGSNKKLSKLTNWKQKYSIDQGLEEAINWFRNNLDRYKYGDYNV